MPNLRVDSIKSSDGTKGPVITGNVVFSGTSHIVLPKGTTAQRPSGVAAGSLRFNTDTKLVEQYNGTEWVTLNSYGVGRGVFGGGNSGAAPAQSDVKSIEYITISSTGSGSYFGDLTTAKAVIQTCSSSTRGIFAGNASNVIEYITIATTGNATDFGDAVDTRKSQLGCCSSSTRGILAGGYNPALTPTSTNSIQYVTIATTGNATDFGDLTANGSSQGAFSSSTRGVFMASTCYITIATTGNATTFGNMSVERYDATGCSSSTRGLYAGGVTTYSPSYVFSNVIDYVTIATTGNAQDFGDISLARGIAGGCSSQTRGIFAGGYTVPPAPAVQTLTYYNTIEYVTIATIGNTQDFGDLTVTRSWNSGCSDSHGGLA